MPDPMLNGPSLANDLDGVGEEFGELVGGVAQPLFDSE
ncbi:MAG: hypothetical protein ACJAVK_001448, partial [Akkermansiaceae bacterium]